MKASRRQIRLCAFPHVGPLSWRNPACRGEGDLDFGMYVEMTRALERGKFDAFFMADAVALNTWTAPVHLGPYIGNAVAFEPFTLLGGLAAVTSRIGLMATASTTYNHPYHVARKFASLDHISGGRAGWNVVTSMTENEAANFGLVEQMDNDQRYARANEFVDNVLALWDSWDDDAFERDRATGRFYDPAKMRVPHLQGAHFSIRGPLNVPRPPQGRPVLCQAGSSPAGRELAARTADLVFVNGRTIDEGRKVYTEVKTRARSYGRSPDELLVLPGLFVVAGGTDEEANRKMRDAKEAVDMPSAKRLLNLFFPGIDLQALGDDDPIPVRPDIGAAASRAAIPLEENGRRLTVRDLCTSHGNHWRHFQIVGSCKRIADLIQIWLEHEAADGFNLMPLSLPGGFTDFVDGVVPELQRRGIFRTDYEGGTLRENLGLPRPLLVGRA